MPMSVISRRLSIANLPLLTGSIAISATISGSEKREIGYEERGGRGRNRKGGKN